MQFFKSQRALEAEVAKRTTEACEHIISEMGAEIHDDLIQRLSIFRLYIDRIERASGDQKEVEALTLKMNTEFDSVIRSVKNLSRRLLPARMDNDTLIEVLSMLCQNMEHPGTGHIHFENTGEPRPIDKSTEMYIFRIVQELIHNAFKHSSAWHVWVRLEWHNEFIAIEVEDDGSGFTRIPEYIERLKKKNNTLRMRTKVIGAEIDYLQGAKGLLAKLKISYKPS